MGMYNEVFCKCPRCGGRGYMQISQIVLGFGGFDLDNYHTLDDLDIDHIMELRARVLNKDFVCDDCGNIFNPYRDTSRELLIYKLFSLRKKSE